MTSSRSFSISSLRFQKGTEVCMAWFTALPDARRIRSYILRLPLCTRGLIFAITAFWVASIFLPQLEQWGALIPDEINLGTCEDCDSSDLWFTI